MSPRRHRRSPTSQSESSSGASHERVDEFQGQDWLVRSITGSASTKAYRCPGCDQEIRPATPHVVTWPVDEGMQERRHWHSPCWARRDRARPTR
ncbi:MAG TPA: hypothetical protein DHW34_05565 [Actinobacteria bacterium]|nr:hypothetical protein [Actinomycetota bacterium]